MRAIAVALLAALGAGFASEPAQAHGRTRVTVGVGVGLGYPVWGPYWGPWYYPPPYYYPAPVIVRTEPVTYIEQRTTPVAEQGWWYYCESANGYYPYVKTCPTGWRRVAPTPPPPAR
jgi:hypothetical protein